MCNKTFVFPIYFRTARKTGKSQVSTANCDTILAAREMSGLTKPVTKCHNPEEENFDKPTVFRFTFMFMFVYFVYELSMAGKVYNMVFWIMTPCSLVSGGRHFRETYCIHLPHVVTVIVCYLTKLSVAKLKRRV